VAVDADAVSNTVLPRTLLQSVPYSLVSADGDRRVALPGPAPISIDQPGSYYLTGNLTVSAGDAITINSNQVTLDLNGFTISSTAPVSTGAAVLLPAILTDVTIMNGHISSGVTWQGGNVFSGPGFDYGIYCPFNGCLNNRASGISVVGC